MPVRLILLFTLFAATIPTLALPADAPSRKAEKGCVWQRFSDAPTGLQGWVQRCDLGDRKIDLFMKEKSLFLRYSDGGKSEPLVDVIDLLPNETGEAGVKRFFAAGTDKKVASRCVLAFHGTKGRSGVKRYTFVPNAKYAKELAAKADPNDVPEPPCGDLGDMPDGIQYFEVPTDGDAGKFLFVRVGQDEPLFDEQTLHLVAPPPAD